MKLNSRTIVKNLVVAATIGLAAVAAWAITDLRVPTIDVAANASQQG